jgi:starch synthase
VHLVAEYWPYVRTGGLAEAVRGIADGQARRGARPIVVLPLHRTVRERTPGLRAVGGELRIPGGGGRDGASIQLFEDPQPAAAPRVLFVRHDPSFDRDGVYGEAAGYSDNPLRFALLARTALHVLPRLFETPPVLHLHDWHTALAAVLLRTEFADNPFYDAVSTVLTVHNAGYQGHLVPALLPELGVPDEHFHADGLEWYGLVNLLKGGLHFADAVTTVSPTHARELRTEEGGFGLHHSFQGLSDRLTGVLNGIDHEVWDPARDPQIPCRYAASDLSGKEECKRVYQQRNGLKVDPSVPLFAMSARLVEQKGFDLVLGSGIVGRGDAQWVILGEGEPRYRDAIAALSARFPQRVVGIFTFTDDEEHRLLAAADGLLMPSLYEPCGLTQMRAQRYGVLPIVRRVGGLADTVEHGLTGFVFDEYQPGALVEAVDAAIRLHRDRARWVRRVRAAMERDFSWDQAVHQYDDVYRAARDRRAGWIDELEPQPSPCVV